MGISVFEMKKEKKKKKALMKEPPNFYIFLNFLFFIFSPFKIEIVMTKEKRKKSVYNTITESITFFPHNPYRYGGIGFPCP